MKMNEYKIQTLRVCEDPAPTLDSASVVLEAWKNHVTSAQWFDPMKEALVVFTLTTKLKCSGFNLISLGSINETVANPREIFRPAIMSASYAIILAHNHPSGDPAPSEADRRLTRRIVEAGEILRISMTDHVIIGSGETPHFSFREAGLI